MPKRSSSLLTALFLPFVALCLFSILFGVAYLLNIPEQAAQKYGPPSTNLSTAQLYRLSIQLLLSEPDLVTPQSSLVGEIPFQVELGESIPSITLRLQQIGLVDNPMAFQAYLQYAGLDTSLQAGMYRLDAKMSPVEIAQRMQNSTPTVVSLPVLAGWRIEEIAAALPTSGLEISPKAFISAAQLPNSAAPLAEDGSSAIPESHSVEGFLYPSVYEVARQTSAPELIALMLKRFDQEINSEMRLGFTNQNLTLFQAVTLASIVEREAVDEAEMPLIASVFLNRLNIGMTLSADPTVQYALGFNETQNTWWTNPLSRQDLTIESLYNTYIYAGLPPGPIANPGKAALQAVAFPAQTPYYFFRALCDGSGRHAFAETYEEHLGNACP